MSVRNCSSREFHQQTPPAAPGVRSGLSIVAGLDVVILAQFWPAIPLASAILLIACGALVLVQAQVRRGTMSSTLALLQVVAYGFLVCLAIGAQWDLAWQSTGRFARPILAADTALAITGLAMVGSRIARLVSTSGI